MKGLGPKPRPFSISMPRKDQKPLVRPHGAGAARAHAAVIVKAGVIVVCPNRHLIGRIREEIRHGDPFHPNNIRYERRPVNQFRRPGDLDAGKCAICGHPYIKDNAIRTSHGWIPHQPAIERPAPRKLRIAYKRGQRRSITTERLQQ